MAGYILDKDEQLLDTVENLSWMNKVQLTYHLEANNKKPIAHNIGDWL
ncbi:hypothetical protein [Paenibacillus macquariensis]|nr:hypothetical protein [Paenibacillus macquariensis]MEC0090934.1 hypothetical protein [Paenibacillus macquariensis]